jgi:hypothetical protein
MIIRTICFDPLRVTVDSQEVPVEKTLYLDEYGITQELFYIMLNGEKYPIKYQEVLLPEFSFPKVDETLGKIEVKRVQKELVKAEALKKANAEIKL